MSGGLGDVSITWAAHMKCLVMRNTFVSLLAAECSVNIGTNVWIQIGQVYLVSVCMCAGEYTVYDITE